MNKNYLKYLLSRFFVDENMFMSIEKVKKRACILLFALGEEPFYEKETFKKFRGGAAHVYVQVPCEKST